MDQNSCFGGKPLAYVSIEATVASDATCLPGCWIGPGVRISSGVTVAPGAAIGMPSPKCPSGETEIGPNVWIGPSTHVETGVMIAEGANIGPFNHIRHGVDIGPGAYVGPRCTIMDHARIGEATNLVAEVYVCEYAELGSHCQISPGVALVNDRYPPTSVDVRGPVIGQCAILGVNSVVWPGVKIGYHAMLASLSEARENVDDYVLVRGCPARPVCDVRQIRLKHEGQWIYPYPWMRFALPGEDITQPAYRPKNKHWGQK